MVFQSTPPVKAAMLKSIKAVIAMEISIHAAREGGDLAAYGIRTDSHKFQSTPPVKAATVLRAFEPETVIFQSTPPVKAATPNNKYRETEGIFQSTPPVKAATSHNLVICFLALNFNPRRP